jgi:hypothetical protein
MCLFSHHVSVGLHACVSVPVQGGVDGLNVVYRRRGKLKVRHSGPCVCFVFVICVCVRVCCVFGRLGGVL